MVLIDVPVGEVPAATAFWSAALGVPAVPDTEEEQFTSLRGALPHAEADALFDRR